MVDNASKYCRAKDIDIIFVEVNVEENAKSDVGLFNPDRALMRFEFMDAILRIANRKYNMVRHGAGRCFGYVEFAPGFALFVGSRECCGRCMMRSWVG